MIPWEKAKDAALEAIANAAALRDGQALQVMCKILRDSIPHYQWVGIYTMNHAAETLHLLCFEGLPTDHVTIPFGKGICGQVAVSGEAFFVPDVREQSNYISCNAHVRSEVVFPIYAGGQLVAQIDIDSNALDPFGMEDSLLLSALSEHIGKHWAKFQIGA